jgi:hypothetical protein
VVSDSEDKNANDIWEPEDGCPEDGEWVEWTVRRARKERMLIMIDDTSQ